MTPKLLTQFQLRIIARLDAILKRADPRKQLKGVELRLQRRIANGSVSPVIPACH